MTAPSPKRAPLSTPRRDLLRALAVVAAGWPPLRTALAQPGPAAPAELRVAFQKGTINLALLKQRGLLEQRLPATRVSWVEFPAGPQILEALAVGSVDLGATGDSPPVFAQAAGKDLFYIGAEPPKPDSSAILVKPDAPLATLADLKGRRVAFQKGSSAHYLTLQALAKAGWPGPTSPRSTWPRPTHALPSSAARSTPGRSGTPTTPRPRSTARCACWLPAGA